MFYRFCNHSVDFMRVDTVKATSSLKRTCQAKNEKLVHLGLYQVMFYVGYPTAKDGKNEAIFTPHAQHERGKMIGVSVHIYICVCLWFESYFSDRLTFSNIRVVRLLVEFID